MSKKSRNYYQWAPELHHEPRRRKRRLVRIRHNQYRRALGLVSKSMAIQMAAMLRDGDRLLGRDGWPISLRSHLRHQDDLRYKMVAVDYHRGVRVSTIWIGSMFKGPESVPRIFETMVFAAHNEDLNLICHRYATEREARLGHVEILELVRQALPSKPRSPNTP